MFRPMVRFKQQISEEECIRVLKEQKRGVLSMIGDDGYPYGVPINHWYCEEDGKLYFHGGMKGHRIDAVERCDKVSFCVYDEGYKKEGEWALNINSVIVFGRIAKVTDEEKRIRIISELTRKFTDDEAYLARELKGSLQRTLLLELTIEHMTGKLVNEA
ncbi:MAG: pyridoxamine 5'-phosphate oxidase family protein [Lachnospiraceae bacterium]|nr:pyridoxamine 5'-phosphate oxidase family protein [Lachnospiraceae bacterium]